MLTIGTWRFILSAFENPGAQVQVHVPYPNATSPGTPPEDHQDLGIIRWMDPWDW